MDFDFPGDQVYPYGNSEFIIACKNNDIEKIKNSDESVRDIILDGCSFLCKFENIEIIE